MEIYKLGDLGAIVTGTTPPKQNPEYFSFSGIPFLTPSDITFGRRRNFTERFLSPSGVEWAKKRILPPGASSVVCIGSTIGKVSQIDRPTLTNQQLNSVVPDAAKCDANFLYYSLTNIGSDLKRIAGGSTAPILNKSEFAQLEIKLPKLMEQRRIAGVLGALDDKIESNQAVVTRAEQLIDAIAEQKATVLPTVALSEVCSLSKSTWKPDTSSDQTVHLFSLPAFDEGAVPEQAAVSTIKSNKTLVDRPGILVSRLNPRISRMWWVETDATSVSVCSPEFAYLTAGDMHGLACTWLAVRSPEFRGEIVDRVTGTSGSHQRVRPADLMTIGVPDYRSLAEHTQMTVLTLLHLVSARRQQSVALAELRDALLPELMSGRMRVDEAGRLVSEALDEEVADV
jgi:type I restriction/modification system specificity determinant hsdS (S protein)